MTDDQSPPWLPLGEAAQRLGITVDALRSKVRRGLVEHRKGNDGRIMVAVTGEAPPSQGLVDLDELAEARAEVERWRTLAEERGIELARAEERVTATERVAAAEVAAKEELIQELRKISGSLRAELAEARRPWWRRLIG